MANSARRSSFTGSIDAETLRSCTVMRFGLLFVDCTIIECILEDSSRSTRLARPYSPDLLAIPSRGSKRSSASCSTNEKRSESPTFRFAYAACRESPAGRPYPYYFPHVWSLFGIQDVDENNFGECRGC